MSAATWWKPWTYGAVRWEWRDDCVRPTPAEPVDEP
jgi:hypothetical protein